MVLILSGGWRHVSFFFDIGMELQLKGPVCSSGWTVQEECGLDWNLSADGFEHEYLQRYYIQFYTEVVSLVFHHHQARMVPVLINADQKV